MKKKTAKKKSAVSCRPIPHTVWIPCTLILTVDACSTAEAKELAHGMASDSLRLDDFRKSRIKAKKGLWC